METTIETVSPFYEDVCVKDEFDFPSNSVAVCENLDSKCFIKKKTDDLCNLNYENKNFVDNVDGGVVGNDMCLKKVKSDIDDLNEGFSYESSCSTDSYELSYVVKSEKKLTRNLFELKNCKQSAKEPCTNAADGITLLFCDACGFSTKYRGNIIRHIKSKHSAGHNFKMPKERKPSIRIYCYFCPFTVLKKSIMSRHIFKAHVFDLPEGDFDEEKSCYICNYESANKMEFLAHFITTHHVDLMSIETRLGRHNICQHCNYSNHCKTSLRKHIEAVHLKIRPYSCHLCDYRAYRSKALRIHVSAKHEKIKPFKCGICKYSSAYKIHLRRHVRTQHEMKKKRKPHVRRCHTQKND